MFEPNVQFIVQMHYDFKVYLIIAEKVHIINDNKDSKENLFLQFYVTPYKNGQKENIPAIILSFFIDKEVPYYVSRIN